MRFKTNALRLGALFLLLNFISFWLHQSRRLSLSINEPTVLESILQASTETLSKKTGSDHQKNWDESISTPLKSQEPSVLRVQAASSPTTIDDNSFDLESFQEDTTVIAMISFGNATRQNHVQRCLRSIRARGQWKGRVVVLTDAPQNYQDLVLQDPLLQILTPREQDWQEMPVLPSEKLKYKRFKTFLIDYMAEDPRLHNVGHILYLDVDVIVGKPISPWIKETWKRTWSKSSYEPREMSFMYMFGDMNGGKTAHSGVILLHSKLSNGCLHTWRKKLDKVGMTKKSRDQYMLRMMRREGPEKTGCAITTWTKTDKDLLFPMPNDFEQRTVAQFVHITNTYHAGQTDAQTQRAYLEEVLNLTDKERQDPNSLAIVPDGF
eukprot:scaffold4511_cov171-Amphora_coffeaeformis.AAC.29